MWKPVPGYPGAFIDMASLVHRDTSGIPRDPEHDPFGPADTTVDATVHGYLVHGVGFYCDQAVQLGDLHFQVGNGGIGPIKFAVFPTTAAQPMVCGARYE